MRILLLNIFFCLFSLYAFSQTCNLAAPLPTSPTKTACTIDLKWKPITGADHYEVKYKLSGTSNWIDTLNTGPDTTVSITGLTAKKKYVNKVTAFCTGEIAGGTGTINVKTNSCTPPVVTTITVQSETSVFVSWDGCPSSYNSIRYRLTGTFTWTTINTGSIQSATLTGLTYSSTYEFQVKSCSSSSNVNWSPIATFTVVFPVTSQPNILILLLDDGSYNTYSFNGGPSFFNSPNIERIATEGVNFTNSYVTMAVCQPSRATLITGLYPNHHGLIVNSDELDNSIATIGSILQNSGYYTAYLGKYCDIVDVTPRTGWDYWMAFESGTGLHQDADYNINGISKEIVGFNDYTLTDSAIGIIKNQAGSKPFLIVLAYSGVHSPYLAPPGLDGIYDNVPLSVPDNFYKFEANYPDFIYEGKAYDDTATCISDLKGMYEMLSGIDSSVSRLFNTMDSLNETDSTLIIYTSDNGLLRGEHMLDKKNLAYEPAMRVPLFVRYPKWFAANSQITGPMVLNVDLAPTVLDAAGVPNTYDMDGFSLRDYYNGTRTRNIFYYESAANFRAVRTYNYKYVWYNCTPDIIEEFFDLTADSEENTNHINTASYASIIEDYRNKLDSLKTFFGDTVYPIQPGPCVLVNPVYDKLAEGDEFENQFQFYPNPTDGQETILLKRSNRNNSPAILQILNMMGEIIYTENFIAQGAIFQKEIELKDLPDGMYWVMLKVDNHNYALELIVDGN